MELPKPRRHLDTESELIGRIDCLEEKVDRILAKMEQANGAWLFLKWIGSIAIGIAILANSIKTWYNG
jgi:hypothetical protein